MHSASRLVTSNVLAALVEPAAGFGPEVAGAGVTVGPGVAGAGVVGALVTGAVPPEPSGATEALTGALTGLATGTTSVVQHVEAYSSLVELHIVESNVASNSKEPQLVGSPASSMNAVLPGSGRRLPSPQIRHASEDVIVLLHPQYTPTVA